MVLPGSFVPEAGIEAESVEVDEVSPPELVGVTSIDVLVDDDPVLVDDDPVLVDASVDETDGLVGPQATTNNKHERIGLMRSGMSGSSAGAVSSQITGMD